jgi:hypothetical protein
MIVSTQLVSFGIARVVDSDASNLKKVALDWAPLCTIRNLCDATRARCDAQSESLQSESLESARGKKLIRFGAFSRQVVAAAASDGT